MHVQSRNKLVSVTIFHHNSNSMEIAFSCNSIVRDHIATNFANTTATKICFMQNFVALLLRCGWEQSEIFIPFRLWWKHCLWNGPLEQCRHDLRHHMALLVYNGIVNQNLCSVLENTANLIIFGLSTVICLIWMGSLFCCISIQCTLSYTSRCSTIKRQHQGRCTKSQI